MGAITATVTARARRLTAAEALQFILRGRAFISLILVPISLVMLVYLSRKAEVRA